MSSVVERDISHIRSLHSIGLGSQNRVTSKLADYLIDNLIPRSKDRFCVVNCVASVLKDEGTDQLRKVMAADLRDSMML